MSKPVEQPPKATLVCPQCSHTARRLLAETVACRGHRETPTEPATCPKCRIPMLRAERHLRYTAYGPEDYSASGQLRTLGRQETK
jgi:hypothetical protein